LCREGSLGMKALRNYLRDAGRLIHAGCQEQASKRLLLVWSGAMEVKVEEKGLALVQIENISPGSKMTGCGALGFFGISVLNSFLNFTISGSLALS